jgi:beta-lactamase class D
MNRLLRSAILSSICLCLITSILIFSTNLDSILPAAGLTSNKINLSVRDIDFKKHFQDLKVEGSILIYDADRDLTYQFNPRRNETEFLPASTFKILNALISLETKVIADELAVLTWDGIERKLPEWNRDLNMKEAMKLSAVWFYQVLARRVGHEQMQKWVTLVGYGNHQIGGKEDIDKFWLEGKLRITPQAQIQFLRRLYRGDLPFSQRSQSIVREMTIVEQTSDYTIRGKTGWVGFIDNIKPQIGWYVGYLEKDKHVYFFATNIEIRTKADPAARKELTRRCLHDLALI